MVLAIAWVLLALATSAHFVLATAVTPHVADPALVVTGALFTAAVLLLMGGIPRPADLRRFGGRGLALALGAGALSIALAPALVATSRYTDSPAGTVTAFWTTAVWGALLIFFAALPAQRYLRAAAALLGVAAAAGVLGNWERPSSFSLVVLHTDQEIALLLAGVAWAAAILIARKLASVHGPAPVYSLAALGGLAGSLAWALPSSAWDVGALLAPSLAYPAAASQALALALALYLALRTGPHVPGAAMLLVVPVVTSLLFVEEATGVFGPRPILTEPASWSSAVMVVSAGLVLLAGAGRRDLLRAGVRNVSVVLAAGSVLLALAGFTLPGVAVAVRGTTSVGAEFAADFVMRGFQTVGGWLALAVALLALAVCAGRAPGRAGTFAALLAALVAAGAYVHVRYTPLHVWMRWIPPEVQQDYGSEYATIVFTPVATPVQIAAMALGVAAIALVSAGRRLAVRAEQDFSSASAGGTDR